MSTVSVITSISNLLSVALEAIAAANEANAVLQQAQTEGWTDTDSRWDKPFADLDAALAAARARLG